MDKTYLDRIKWRRELMAKHQTDTVLALPGSEAMVNELYIWLFGTYLPRRYPRIFTLIAPAITSSGYSKDDRSLYLRNRITQESVSLTPPTDPVAALTTISSHIDTDFLLLAPQPDEEPEAEEKYHLLALANCCPSGFSPKEKLGLPLNQIHAPVPAYASKLEKSMDRFFASLPRGKVVARANWTVQLDGELFCLKGNHGDKDGPLEGEELRTERERVDVSKCRLRAERQTLHRLSETGALVFAFKTYLYPFKDVKDEGLGEDMAEAIEGLGSGSVPEMPAYKRREVWGDKVAAYLRSTE
ncbi:hypothetical protein ANO11243_021420 [Dothideomycetidae sp. 11243]|nr:hypothetical protein ANO11243_021420 [fungal sp. No.11243]